MQWRPSLPLWHLKRTKLDLLCDTAWQNSASKKSQFRSFFFRAHSGRAPAASNVYFVDQILYTLRLLYCTNHARYDDFSNAQTDHQRWGTIRCRKLLSAFFPLWLGEICLLDSSRHDLLSRSHHPYLRTNRSVWMPGYGLGNCCQTP